MRFLVRAMAIFLAAPVATGAQPPWSDWVHRVEAVRADGTTDQGSAVSIAAGRVITNCHVVRHARRIVLSRNGERRTARPDVGDVYRDLCFLEVPGLNGPIPAIADPDSRRVGQAVVAAGYSGGGFSLGAGRVKGLFSCACDGGQVIQTSAVFAPGASGGGLFDEAGRLLGILTFKSVAGGDFHFAVPVGWMARLNRLMPDDAGDQRTFWEGEGQGSGHFLAACDLQARGDWRALGELARDWTRQEPADPQSWMALGRAESALGRPAAALEAYQRVLRLDSTHAEAAWAIQELEFELDAPR
jgi:serine protease Do